jgi:hypothetical protein
MQVAVLNAAADYKRETGNRLQVNSAKRSIEDQTRLYNTSVRNGTPGVQPNGRLVARPNPNAPHMRGNAIDLQQGISDTARTNRILARHKLINDFGRRDLPHYELKAEDGGIFDGPNTGYPIKMHGSEMVSPLNMNSVLMKLAKTPATESAKNTPAITSSKSDDSSKPDALYSNILKMNSDIANMLDRVIDVLESDHSTQNKILTNSYA